MKRKKILSFCLSLCMMISLLPACSRSAAAQTETEILLSDDGISVDGSSISADASSPVYQSTKIETHEDVAADLKDLENTVVNITKAGVYRISGEIENAQIAVSAGEEDNVTLILDGVSITCRTAPAIMVYSACEPAEAEKAGVTIYLEENSENTVNGSHTLKTETDTVKHDAAVSSNVSLIIDGSGSLTVNGDNEGIEVKYKHLTINNGIIHVISQDDSLNCSEDGIAHITINGGYLYCSAANGEEGDGIDSNGYITINGGTVIALANPNSMDSGLDSDSGTVINGGTVVGAGNMFDPLEEDSEQLYMFLQFSEAIDNLICVTDENENPIFAYDLPNDYSYLSFSTPYLTEGTYHVYIGGTIEGDESEGLYTNITSYSGGIQMQHGGKTEGSMGRGMHLPQGQKPEGTEKPYYFEEGTDTAEKPREYKNQTDGSDTAGRPQPPEGGKSDGNGPRGMSDSAGESSVDFVLSAANRSFTNVKTSEKSDTDGSVLSFQDVSDKDWFFNSVTAAGSQGLMSGLSETEFAPNKTMTAAELISVLFRMDGGKQETATEGNWYDTAVAWGQSSNIAASSFEAEKTVSREDTILMIYHMAKNRGLDVSKKDDLSSFTDTKSIAEEALEAVKWAVGSGLVKGSGNQLNPEGSLTRAEAAAILVQFSAMLSA